LLQFPYKISCLRRCDKNKNLLIIYIMSSILQ
jgi:hypothetical protein